MGSRIMRTIDRRTRIECNPMNDAALREEAEFIHQMLFGRSVPELIAARYVRAHDHYVGDASPILRRIMDCGLDLEAIEFASRHHHSVLTKKIHIVLYLVEAAGEYYEHFVNTRTRRVEGWIRLAGATFRASWKKVKGTLLIRRHDLL